MDCLPWPKSKSKSLKNYILFYFSCLTLTQDKLDTLEISRLSVPPDNLELVAREREMTELSQTDLWIEFSHQYQTKQDPFFKTAWKI